MNRYNYLLIILLYKTNDLKLSDEGETKVKNILITVIGFSMLISCSSKKIGIVENKLTPCPGKPNCVCSQDMDKDRYIEPFKFIGSGPEAMKKIVSIIERMKRSKIIVNTGNYIHAEFSSSVFGFIDDVEFLLDEKNSVIQVRSGARTGYSDFGVNRRRVTAIREKFNK